MTKIIYFEFVLEKTYFAIKNEYLIINTKMKNKGHKVELSTFKSWRKEEIVGCTAESRNGKTFLNAMFCYNKFVGFLLSHYLRH